jgi:hypothetical protein
LHGVLPSREARSCAVHNYIIGFPWPEIK